MEKKLYLRGDAAFAIPDIYEYLEGKGILYAIRLKANNNLHREIEHLMTRPVGRPSRKPKVFFHSFSYRAGSLLPGWFLEEVPAGDSQGGVAYR
jgi:hypothetical protein